MKIDNDALAARALSIAAKILATRTAPAYINARKRG